MFIDTNLVLCDNEDVSAAAGTEVIASAIDLGIAGASVIGSDMHLVISVSTAFVGSGATVTFRLVSDSTDPASTDGSETRHVVTQAYTMANLAKNFVVIIPLPGGSIAYERYLQLQVVTAGATTTAGSINAFLTRDPANWRAHPKAVD